MLELEFDVKIQQYREKETGEIFVNRVFKNMRHAAATVRRTAMALFKPSAVTERRVIGSTGRRRKKKFYKPSPAGSAPGTATGRLRRSIFFEADDRAKSFFVGPRASTADQVAKAHEFGGNYKGQSYPARPFMKPALDKNLHRLGGQFTGSLGG